MASPQTKRGVSKARLEALSDGLFAIVMTLLIFQLMSPLTSDAKTADDLHSALLVLWPKFVSFAISFIMISVFWVGHHSYFYAVQGVDESQLWLNLLILFCIALIPFSADLIGEHHDLRTGEIIYGLNLTAAACALRLNWWYASSRHLVRPDVDSGSIKQIHNRGMVIIISSLIAIAVAWFNPVVAFYLYVVNAFGQLVLQLRTKPLQRILNPNQGVGS